MWVLKHFIVGKNRSFVVLVGVLIALVNEVTWLARAVLQLFRGTSYGFVGSIGIRYSSYSLSRVDFIIITTSWNASFRIFIVTDTITIRIKSDNFTSLIMRNTWINTRHHIFESSQIKACSVWYKFTRFNPIANWDWVDNMFDNLIDLSFKNLVLSFLLRDRLFLHSRKCFF